MAARKRQVEPTWDIPNGHECRYHLVKFTLQDKVGEGIIKLCYHSRHVILYEMTKKYFTSNIEERRRPVNEYCYFFFIFSLSGYSTYETKFQIVELCCASKSSLIIEIVNK